MRILAIETSCDETAIALLKASGGLKSPRFEVLKSIVSSQIETHRPWGGVVPNLAKREHIKNLPVVFEQILKSQNPNDKFQINLLAVTVGPGLEPCLWTGIAFAKEVHKNYFPEAELVGVNHLEGHIYSNLLKNIKVEFPAVSLVVSGGHTILLYMKSLAKWEKLGETRDDAVGECFDKVGRMLELPFPGGPEIEKLAAKGDPDKINFPRPMIDDKSYDFSFSGLKTSVLYFLKGIGNKELVVRNGAIIRNSKFMIPDICASFQQAAVDVLVSKTVRASRVAKAKSVMLSGGVAANKFLRKTLEKESKKIGAKFFAPEAAYNADNAAMIGAAAYISFLRKKNRSLRAGGNLNL